MSVLNKIKMISDKWNRIESTLQEQKNLREQHLNSLLKRLEQKIIRSTQPTNEINRLQESLNNLQEQTFISDSTETKLDKYNKLNTQIEECRNVNSKSLENLEKRITTFTFDSYQSIENQLDSQNQTTYTTQVEKIQMLNDSYNQIVKVLEDERNERSKNIELIKSDLDERIQEFYDYIVVEQRVRKETENKIFEMIKDINSNLNAQMQDEQRERKIMTQSLMQLIDDACLRINKNLNS